MLKSMRWALRLALCVVVGCGTHERPATGEASEQAYGSVHLPLVTPEQEAFRLRDARFDVTRGSETVLTLDSESNPGASSLDADLLQGNYQIALRDGWRLTREGDAGAGETVPAALLTQNPLAFEVDNGRVTQLVYSFTTEQGVVSFGRGSVSVSVAVTPTPLGSCSVLDRASCPNGQTCLFAGDSGQTYCAEPGSLPVGSPCSSEQCVAGAQCLSLDPAHRDDRTCARFCDPASRFCGCQTITADPGVGVCSEATLPGVVFSHDFVPGDATVACSEWNSFRNQLTSATFARVTLSGSRGGFFECQEPAAADQTCRALRNDSFSNVSCGGHSWTVIDCGGGPELSIDSSLCGCNFPGNNVRPCAGSNFGGVGTNTCDQTPQTIEVTCEGGPTPTGVCGNGVIENGEVCDTNGTGVDVLPAGTPVGSTCNATCTAIVPGNPGACLACARSNCPTQFNGAVGASSSAANTANVTALFDCVIGPNWQAGGPIPRTSCFFTDPNQPGGSLVPCYCGPTPVATCLATGPANHFQACGVQVENASLCNPVTASCVTGSGSNPSVPLGAALQLLNCERAACGAPCGFPPPAEE